MKQVYLQRGKARPVQSGHPWVFAGSIDRVEGEGSDDVVEVFGDRGDRLGLGLYSEASSIRVRMLGSGHAFNETVLKHRIEGALARRKRLGLVQATEVYRLVNSEGDGLPGLTVDVFGEALATFLPSTAPMYARRAEVAGVLREMFPAAAILERPAPPAIARLEGFPSVQTWHTDPLTSPIVAREHGVAYVIDPDAMQKTGHYADMREERLWIGGIAGGQRILDVYSYTGGFALHAARGGATRMVTVDSSAAACAGVRANAEANGFEIEVHTADAGDYVRSAFDRGERFDIVVLDPPKLAPSRKHVEQALKVYTSVALQAGRLVDAGGLLCMGSCSEAIGADELGRVLGHVTERLGRATSIVRVGGQPADHPYPAAMPEGRYLTFVAAALD